MRIFQQFIEIHWGSVDYGSGFHNLSTYFVGRLHQFDMSETAKFSADSNRFFFCSLPQEVKTLRFCKLCKEAEVPNCPNWQMLESSCKFRTVRELFSVMFVYSIGSRRHASRII